MTRTSTPPRRAAVALALLLALPAAAGGSAPGPLLSPAELEQRYGIAVTRVALIGAGGMVDLRFTVRDPEKARPLLEGGKAPGLVGRRGTALQAPHHGAQRSIRLQKDAPCFVLYPNARGAVRPGAPVSVTFGSVRAGPIAAQ